MPSRLLSLIVLLAIVSTTFAHPGHDHSTPVEVPYVDGDWWQVAGNPDLGTQSSNQQQPVDFALWPAADGTWQLWSCIRGTKCGGKGRLLYGWEGKRISDANWKPAGIKMEADEAYGELKGGLQAPHVVKQGDTYFSFMAIGTISAWRRVKMARSSSA